MKKIFVLLLAICFMGIPDAKGQYVQLPTIDIYDTGLMNAHLNAVREMSQRAARIRETVQPYRERQYQCYREGKYLYYVPKFPLIARIGIYAGKVDVNDSVVKPIILK